MIQELLLKLGIPTYCVTIFTQLTGQATQKLGDRLPPQIGWVYGMSTEVNGVTPTDSTQILPTTAQLSNLYLSLKYGATDYVEQIRMTNFLFVNHTITEFHNPNRYLPLNLPMFTDLSESKFFNPTLINGIFVPITMYYIDKTAYKTLLANGQILANGVSMKKG